MRTNGLSALSARNTAMNDVVSELPPIVVSDLFGVHGGQSRFGSAA